MKRSKVILSISDIRKDTKEFDLKDQIAAGLASSPRNLPALILWDDEGQRLYGVASQMSTYYPEKKEMEIMISNADEIAGSIPNSSTLIELGCGYVHVKFHILLSVTVKTQTNNLVHRTVRKTGIILSALERQRKDIAYYALDVSPGELAESLNKLATVFGKSRNLSLSGLFGTYDDCVDFLPNYHNSQKSRCITFLWVGNSLANLPAAEASDLLSRFGAACADAGFSCNFIVSLDACQHEAHIREAYNALTGPMRSFILHGLSNANTILGCEAFQVDDWDRVSEFVKEDRMLSTYYVAQRDTEVILNAETRHVFKKEEKLFVIRSGKWSEADVQEIARNADMRVDNTWRDAEGAYCEFHAISLEFRRHLVLMF